MKYKNYLAVIFLTSSAQMNCVDNPHFYRATNMFLEPRLEHDYLLTFDATVSGGSTTQGRSASNTIVPLLDIYGLTNIQELNVNTPFTNPDNPYDTLLNNLAQLPKRAGFATLSVNGKFHIIESNLSLTQNLSHGLLLFFYLPVRKLKINDISFTDLSPNDDLFPNKNSPEWQAVLQNFNPLLQNYGICTSPATDVGVGDLSTYLGWTHNYQETTTIDFIDITLMAGLLSPTGKQKNENNPFSLPTGYNGHWGLPVCAMLSLGYYEWITFGGYLNALFFLDKDKTMRLTTDSDQSGIIKLTSGNVSVHRGPLVHTGLYFKADHFGHGFSFTTAYSFASQQKSHLTSCNPVQFNCAVINSDPALAGWNMHTFNFILDYDFAHEGDKVGNRIGFFYNLEIAGKRTFNTNIAGGMYGIDISLSM
ncbi:MAG TPA: hypothetical protein VHX42_03665 [Candidatus Babeliales bacterium]|jgi:hypothetical protein|nr:hypothetical protein [Candidatus Babeliales bacterium]